MVQRNHGLDLQHRLYMRSTGGEAEEKEEGHGRGSSYQLRSPEQKYHRIFSKDLGGKQTLTEMDEGQ